MLGETGQWVLASRGAATECSPGREPGVFFRHDLSHGVAKESFAPSGLRSKTTPTPGWRPGLHSVAAPRLDLTFQRARLLGPEARIRADEQFIELDLGRGFASQECSKNGPEKPEWDAENSGVFERKERTIGTHDTGTDQNQSQRRGESRAEAGDSAGRVEPSPEE